MRAAIDVQDAFRLYPSRSATTVALQGLTLTVAAGEIVALLGPSGSGKTTLLRALAGFEYLSAGTVTVLGTDLSRLGATARAAFRSKNIGFVDQHYSRTLPPKGTCRDAVALQLELAGTEREAALRAADTLLARVGLIDRTSDPTCELSGGEQQRVALCAAIAHRPRLLLADEPAGELDAESAKNIYRLLGDVAREVDATVVLVTHDAEAASIADRLVHIRDGRLVEQSLKGHQRALVVSRRGWLRLPEELLKTELVAAERVTDHVELRPLGPDRGTDGEAAAKAPASSPTPQVVAELRSVKKQYGSRRIFSDLSLELLGGRLTAFVGRSGSGKTTLLHLLAGLEKPSDGQVLVSGEALGDKDRAELAALRRRAIALVAQDPGLVPYLTARENTELALAIRGAEHDAASRSERALADVGLRERVDARVETLSAGERQRVAIARALAANAALLLVDEPTARLDEENGRAIGALLVRAARERGIAVVCATHDPVLIALADTAIQLR